MSLSPFKDHLWTDSEMVFKKEFYRTVCANGSLRMRLTLLLPVTVVSNENKSGSGSLEDSSTIGTAENWIGSILSEPKRKIWR